MTTDDFDNNDFQIGISDLIQQYITPKSFFGEEDAAIEWGENPENTASTFFHTKSYQNFQHEGALYLFGRRGTGKTAIMRMFDYEIKNDKIRNYCCSYVVNQEDAYNDLATQLRGSPLADLPDNELVHFLIKKWHWVLMSSAMISVYKKFKSIDCENEHLKAIEKFLSSEKLIPNSKKRFIEGPWHRVTELVTTELSDIDYKTIKLGLAIKNISMRLITPDFEDAIDSLVSLLEQKGTNCVVLIDSIEVYRLNDKISKSVVTSLIESVIQLYANRKKFRVIAKASFPSEIYPLLSSLNQEKIEGKNLFILWRYKDLICLVAKRHYSKFNDGCTDDQCEFLDNFNVAQDYLYKYLPPRVHTGQNLQFDTMAYIIRHTQKKPRQLILIFNIIYTMAEEQGIKLPTIPQEFISLGVHARLDILIKGTLDIFEQIYPNAERLIKRILNLADNRFKANNLDILIKESHSLRAESDLTVEEVKRLLLESGSIGVIAGRHSIEENDIKLYECLFEYQVKGILTISNKTWLVVHPMMYQELNIKINMKDFIYPMPIEDEEKMMLLKQGIILGGVSGK